MSTEELRLKLEVAEAELKLKKVEVQRLKNQIADIEWQPIEWAALEQLLKSRDDGGTDYKRNPIVGGCRGWNETYCFITRNGELQVGPYFRNFDFPRDQSLYINASKTWAVSL